MPNKENILKHHAPNYIVRGKGNMYMLIKSQEKTVVPVYHQSLLTKHFNKLYNHNANLTTIKHLMFSLTGLNKKTSLFTKMAHNKETTQY